MGIFRLASHVSFQRWKYSRWLNFCTTWNVKKPSKPWDFNYLSLKTLYSKPWDFNYHFPLVFQTPDFGTEPPTVINENSLTPVTKSFSTIYRVPIYITPSIRIIGPLWPFPPPPGHLVPSRSGCWRDGWHRYLDGAFRYQFGGSVSSLGSTPFGEMYCMEI